jgi:cytoskeletal protein RodZ
LKATIGELASVTTGRLRQLQTLRNGSIEVTRMKALGITSTAVLSLLLAVAAPAWAQEQHEQEPKDRPAQQEEKKAQPEKPAKQAEKPAAQQEKNAKPEEKNAQPQEKTAKPEERKAPQQAEKPAVQQERNAQPQEKTAQRQEKTAKPEENDAQQHTVQAQPEGQERHAGGGRIPDDRFRANFGQEHRFRVSRGDYDRDRHFQYGGYSFGFVDAWPSEWLYTQDVYVVEIDGVYYLCNPAYPGVNITLSIAP